MKLVKLSRQIVFLGLAVIVCSGCGGGSDETGTNPSITTAASNKERNLAPVAAPSTKLSLVSGNNTLGLNLLSTVEGNAVVAPFSASLSLARLRVGAKGVTLSAINGVMHIDGSALDVDAAYNELALGINDRIGANSLDNSASQAQAGAWTQLGYGYQRTYLDTLAESYGLKPLRLDFALALDDAEQTISAWSSQASSGLATFGAASNDTRLVLADAVALNAAWAASFDPALTATGSFQLLNSGTVDVPFMHQSATLPQTSGDGYLALALPLNGGQQLLLVLPDSGRFREIMAGLTAEKLAQIAGALTPATIDLALPKFTVSSALPMYLGEASSKGFADYSGIDGSNDLYVSAATQNSRLAITEAGLQAGSVTRLVLDDFHPETWTEYGSVTTIVTFPFEITPVVVGLGRPFVFAIRDTDTGALLFVGRVMNPAM